MSDVRLRAQLLHTLSATDFPALGTRYQGKVRDTYVSGERVVLIATDRLSAFDRVLTTIPFKGELLNRLASHWFRATSHVVKNHVIDVPDPCVTVARRARPLPLEFVVRGYVTGSLWRDHQAGVDHWGLHLPADTRRDQRLEAPVLTPSTKAPVGQHDEPITEAEVLRRGLVTKRDWARAKEAALALFAEGQRQAAARGLLLVDTKYEFGLVGDELLVIDEMHTPDSSRYWEADGAEARFAKGEPQRMLDKENIRQWLIDTHGFTGHGEAPAIPDEVRLSLAGRYVEAFERLTGQAFDGAVGDVGARVQRNLKAAGLL